MSMQSVDLTAKRLPDPNDVPPSKRQRSESVETMNITDINDDCLEHIFKYLNFQDLLNVANTSKRMKQAAQLAYKSKFGRIQVNLNYPYTRQKMELSNECINFRDFSPGLKLMRCFGPSISKLRISYLDTCQFKRDEMDRYLNEYCAESVIKLRYEGGSLKNLTNPFPKVKYLSFSERRFQCGRKKFCQLFPNVRELRLHVWADNGSIVAHFPHLKHISVAVRDKSLTNLTKCFQMNQQLQSLRIQGENNGESLRVASKCLQQLETLSVSSDRNFATKSDDKPESIHFKSVRKFETNRDYLKKLDRSNVSLTFDQLEEFTVGREVADKHIIDFLRKHPSLCKFTGAVRQSREAKMELAKVLPSVTEVQIDKWTSFLVYEAIEFVDECKHLKIFEFKLDQSQRTIYNMLMRLLGREWRSTIDDELLVKLERQE